MGSSDLSYDPGQVRHLAAQQAQQTAASFVANEVVKLKTEWIKEAQAQLMTSGAQLFKIDHSLFKWDEKGFTFAGKQIGPNFSLNGLIHGRANAAKKEAEKAEREARKEAEEATRQVLAAVQERAETLEQDLTHQVNRAKTISREAQETARKAQGDAKRADNLLRSANNSARLAADNASRASKSLATLEQRVKALEGVM
ncbi:hypothetical protein [Streptomyces sp. NPDC005890]|uniref:hypothetical protein n=1 Tax=Streptomyces sp. NPDC005890 TaxID=3154568 RepID=UPI0034111379